MKLYNNAVAYLYNNNLASVKPPCGRRESLGTAHIEIKSFHDIIFYFYIAMGWKDCGI